MRDKKHGLVMMLLFTLTLAVTPPLSQVIDLNASVGHVSGILVTVVTDSAGHRGFLLTLAGLTLLSLNLNMSRRDLVIRFTQLAVILVIGFLSKSGLKQLTESPRPYTEHIAQQQVIPSAEQFYQLDVAEQAQVIGHVSDQVSNWRTRHWQGEKDYSFPSGHTIFAAICVAFFAGLFFQQRRFYLACMVVIWAASVAYTRIWIGMHRPEDLFASAAYVTLLYMVIPTFPRLANQALRLAPARVRAYLDQ